MPCPYCLQMNYSLDNSVGIAMGYRLEIEVRFRAQALDFSLHHSAHTGSVGHLASHPVCTLAVPSPG
jgi:hypothetical protein